MKFDIVQVLLLLEVIMAGNILTPTTIWKNFSISSSPISQFIETQTEGDIVLTKMYIDGQVKGEERVKIYGVLVKKQGVEKSPAILLCQDFEVGFDKDLVFELVNKGYTVLSVDLAGKREDSELFTIYPQSISYANYLEVKDNLFYVPVDAINTCWYEWACALRYALKFLKKQPSVSSVGGFGIGKSATALWQVAGTDNGLKCAVFSLNAGWHGYQGIYKFAGQSEPQFSDNMYKFIAGVEPQAYAMHVKCQVLVLSPTNSNEYDLDRSADTVSRISEEVFSAVHYSIGYIDRVNGEAFGVANVFFDKFLSSRSCKFSADSDISCEVQDGKLEIKVSAKGKIKKVELYASEEIFVPCERSWQLVCGGSKVDGDYYFNYLPYQQSGQVTFFAQIYYDNGFILSTRVINKKFKPEEVSFSHKSKILYSSRQCGSESIFSPAHQELLSNAKINISSTPLVEVKAGPMSIEGIYSKYGLITFKFQAQKDKPVEGSILMLDVYAKESGIITIKLISDFFGQKTEYVYQNKIIGGEVWQNIKVEMNKFKTKESMGLKSFDNINAVEFDIQDGEYLLNNILWI